MQGVSGRVQGGSKDKTAPRSVLGIRIGPRLFPDTKNYSPQDRARTTSGSFFTHFAALLALCAVVGAQNKTCDPSNLSPVPPRLVAASRSWRVIVTTLRRPSPSKTAGSSKHAAVPRAATVLEMEGYNRGFSFAFSV